MRHARVGLRWVRTVDQRGHQRIANIFDHSPQLTHA